MKIAVIGSGGVGGYFGAKLAKSENDVTFLTRGRHLEAMQQHGLTVKSIKGDFKVDDVNATDSITAIGKVDLILLGVKAWQVKDIAGELLPLIKNDTMILPLQNGVIAAEELQSVLNPSLVVGGSCRIICKIEAPGVINHFGMEPTIVLGELDKSNSIRTELLNKMFIQAGINTKLSNDIQADIWRKFIHICVSGLMAVTRATYGQLREVKETRQLMLGLFTEVYQLSQKAGIAIESDFVDKTIAVMDGFSYDATTSLARDIWEEKPSELEYQNGTVVRLADKYKLNVPINKFVYDCLLPQEIKARKSQHS